MKKVVIPKKKMSALIKEIKCPLEFEDIKNPLNRELDQLEFILAKQVEGLSVRDAQKSLYGAVRILMAYTTVTLSPKFEAELTKSQPRLSGDDLIQKTTRGPL